MTYLTLNLRLIVEPFNFNLLFGILARRFIINLKL